MDFKTGSHCKYLIALHVILVVKYRKPLLVRALGRTVKNAIHQLAEASEFSVEEMEVDLDHIHLLITITPKYAISAHIRRIKQHTTLQLWKKHPELKRHFWREKTFWSDGYFICSVGNDSAETVRKYIQEQG